MTQISGRLFDGDELFGWLGQRRQQCEQELIAIPVERIVERPLQELADELTSRHRVAPIALRRTDQYRGTMHETKVWASGIATARVRVNTGPGDLGYKVSVRVPFDGEPELLFLKTVGGGTPPPGWVERNELVVPFEWRAGEDPAVDRLLDEVLDKVEAPYLQTQRDVIEEFNDELEALVIDTLTERRDGFLEARQYLDGLRIPVFETRAPPGHTPRPGLSGGQLRRSPAVLQASHSSQRS